MSVSFSGVPGDPLSLVLVTSGVLLLGWGLLDSGTRLRGV